MQDLATTHADLLTTAKNALKQRSERMLHVFSFVPDEKLAWAPSETARNAVRLLAHSAVVCKFCADTITGKVPEPMLSVEEFFRVQGEGERAVTSREDTVALLEESVEYLCEAIDTLSPENIASTVNSPFGPMPLKFWMTLGEEQLTGHTGQLEYLQTIWGDMDNHLG